MKEEKKMIRNLCKQASSYFGWRNPFGVWYITLFDENDRGFAEIEYGENFTARDKAWIQKLLNKIDNRKKYRVTWYIGSVESITETLAIMEVKAENIYSVEWATILPQHEKDRYKANFKYCIRVIHLEEGKKHSIDYGSYSRFVMIEEICN